MLNSMWYHKKSGRKYKVICVANEHASAEKRDQYPVTVSYQGEDGLIWSKKLGSSAEFVGSLAAI